MKANAPEKLYVDVQDNFSDSMLYGFIAKGSDEDIEYTRTDTFIEQAGNFLEMLGCGFAITDNITHTNYGKEQLIEDFKNYMKGE